MMRSSESETSQKRHWKPQDPTTQLRTGDPEALNRSLSPSRLPRRIFQNRSSTIAASPTLLISNCQRMSLVLLLLGLGFSAFVAKSIALSANWWKALVLKRNISYPSLVGRRLVLMLLANFWGTPSGLSTIGSCSKVLVLVFDASIMENINETISKAKNEVKELIREAQDKKLEAEPGRTMMAGQDEEGKG